jgi:hypothetical protein
MTGEKHHKRKDNSSKLIIGLAVTAVIFFAVGYLFSSSGAACVATGSLTSSQVGEKVMKYVSDNLLTDDVTAEILSVKQVNGIYNVSLGISSIEGSAVVDLFTTPDGALLFLGPPPLNTNTPLSPTGDTQGTQQQTITKADSPTLDAFVVSYCPFGLQMQRILAELAPAFGDNINVRYIGYVENGKVMAMHGETEAEENLRQICIREEQPSKFWPYLECFMKSGETESCLAEVGVDTAMLDTCMTDPSKGVNYASMDFAIQDLHGVTGSPTLILNGATASEFNFGAATPDQLESFGGVWGRSAEALKDLLCAGFNTPPAACSQDFNTESAARGFAPSYAGTTTGGGSC